MTLRLGLDMTALEGGHRTRGIGRVAQAYFECLSKESEIDLVPYSRGDFPRSEANGSGGWKNQLVDPWKFAWFLRSDPPDLVQIIDPMKVPTFTSVPIVTMVHDLIPYLYRERYQTNLWSRYLHWRMKRQVHQSNFIITPSRCTADDLEMLFDMDSEKIEPVQHGINHDRFYPRSEKQVKEVRKRLGISDPFFLMVADLQHFDPRKKLSDVINAWDHQLLNGVKLVIVGKRGEYSRRLREKWTGADADLIFPGFVNDDELASLYTGSRMLIFPSRYEGFGFPVLEAMACGTKPVVRAVGSVKEIVGDQAVKLEDESFSDELMDVLADGIKWDRVDKNCQNHARRFTWESAMEKLQMIYRGILEDIPTQT